jgi:anaerobic selenocysteine-containing dehydrogenase
VRVEDGRVVRLEGDDRNPATRGFICGKVRRFPQRLYGPDRLRHPGIRVGEKGAGELRRASWDEALSRVAAEIEAVRARHGGEAILPFSYGGSNGLLTQDGADAWLFERLGASRLARTVCSATSDRACSGLYGLMPGVAYQDYADAALVVLWGANPSTSGIHLLPFLREARRRGARLVVIDPRRTPLAKEADLHLALRPGTDLPLALAVTRWLFEQDRADLGFLARHCVGWEEFRRRAGSWTLERAAAVSGVPAPALESFARLYADSSPAVVRCGWGTERHRHGGSAVAAILALPAVAGKLGVRGGGYTLGNAEAWSLAAPRAGERAAPATRELNMNRLGRLLTGDLAPPIELLFVYNANPLATLPNQRLVRAGLERKDLFTVVFDAVGTDTVRYADVALPATTFLEHTELRVGYGVPVLQVGRPVVEPVGEARPNHDVFVELCRRLGLSREGDPATADQLLRATMAGFGGAAAALAQLDERGVAEPPGGLAPVQMVDALPRTADGMVHLCPEELDAEAPGGLYHFEPPEEDERHPFALLSPASSRSICSTLAELAPGRPVVEIHPDDARRLGIVPRGAVRVHNPWGEVRAEARISQNVRPGVVVMEKGGWARDAPDGNTVNALVPDTLSDLAGGACFSDARVALEPLGDGASP